jgi:hypothetical protein
MTCDTPFRCPETPHSDVLDQNTAPATLPPLQRITAGQRPFPWVTGKRPFGCSSAARKQNFCKHSVVLRRVNGQVAVPAGGH